MIQTHNSLFILYTLYSWKETLFWTSRTSRLGLGIIRLIYNPAVGGQTDEEQTDTEQCLLEIGPLHAVDRKWRRDQRYWSHLKLVVHSEIKPKYFVSFQLTTYGNIVLFRFRIDLVM